MWQGALVGLMPARSSVRCVRNQSADHDAARGSGKGLKPPRRPSQRLAASPPRDWSWCPPIIGDPRSRGTLARTCDSLATPFLTHAAAVILTSSLLPSRGHRGRRAVGTWDLGIPELLETASQVR